jgi:capsular polysaccharide biosynthesis protein
MAQLSVHKVDRPSKKKYNVQEVRTILAHISQCQVVIDSKTLIDDLNRIGDLQREYAELERQLETNVSDNEMLEISTASSAI